MAKPKRARLAGRASRRSDQHREGERDPAGFHAVTPYLTMSDGARALEFYGKAFGAKVRMRMDAPAAESARGDQDRRFGDHDGRRVSPTDGTKAPSSLGGSSSSLFVYVPNVDASFKRAVDAGCRGVMPPTDMFWGDRFGRLIDPFGHHWGLATHKEDVSPAEVKKRSAAAMAQMGQPA
jgi:PhnB protein